MTMLSKKAKDEFRAIYKDEFKEVLTDDEVEEMGVRLLRLFSILVGKDAPPDQSVDTTK